MTLRRNEHPQQQPHLASFSSGSASAFNSPLPSHNGFSTRTRLRPGGPLNNHYQQDNPQFHRIKNGSLPSFEDIGKLPKCPFTPFSFFFILKIFYTLHFRYENIGPSYFIQHVSNEWSILTEQKTLL